MVCGPDPAFGDFPLTINGVNRAKILLFIPPATIYAYGTCEEHFLLVRWISIFLTLVPKNDCDSKMDRFLARWNRIIFWTKFENIRIFSAHSTNTRPKLSPVVWNGVRFIVLLNFGGKTRADWMKKITNYCGFWCIFWKRVAIPSSSVWPVTTSENTSVTIPGANSE